MLAGRTREEGRGFQTTAIKKRFQRDPERPAGWSLSWVSAVDSEGRTIWIVDAHRGDGKRFVARADEKLTALLGLESAVEPFSASSFL